MDDVIAWRNIVVPRREGNFKNSGNIFSENFLNENALKVFARRGEDIRSILSSRWRELRRTLGQKWFMHASGVHRRLPSPVLTCAVGRPMKINWPGYASELRNIRSRLRVACLLPCSFPISSRFPSGSTTENSIPTDQHKLVLHLLDKSFIHAGFIGYDEFQSPAIYGGREMHIWQVDSFTMSISKHHKSDKISSRKNIMK